MICVIASNQNDAGRLTMDAAKILQCCRSGGERVAELVLSTLRAIWRPVTG